MATFSHLGTEAECASCHERDRPASQKAVPHGNKQDCVACHQSQRPWRSPRFGHDPVPEKCTVCHLGDRPEKKVRRFDHTNPVGQSECAQCHQRGAGDRWAKGEFSHKPEPESCLPCHTEDRPARTTHQFDHAKDGMADCAKCHAHSRETWRSATFFHGNEQQSCNRCHERDRPKFRLKSEENKGTTHFLQNDCFDCHQVKDGNVEHFEYRHFNSRKEKAQSCLPCHLEDGKKYHEGDERVALEADEKVSFEGAGNCFDCHRKRASWSVGDPGNRGGR